MEAPYFDYSLTVLAQEIHKLERLGNHSKELKELKSVIEILNNGTGYLTQKPHVKIKFFNEI